MIKIDIFGFWDQRLQNSERACGGCSSSGSCSACCKNKGGIEIANKSATIGGCAGCSSSSKASKTVGQQYQELIEYINNSDIKEKVRLEFYDLKKINVLDYDDIRILTELDYEAPFVVIDGIVRYYGGISNYLIYKDVKELISA
ncbi:MAG: hypothetical protein GX895_13110 [Clostridiales bacterium]|uniref:hypothetical protein n=1 Tax=Clostridium sp. N3C TaxID=1776758 RepID=UPI00092DF793|nr:hypothetical protein [Clostridium sp. N3C]NLZ49689.1 hypothetical protein [Clostridiales bacterium]SCN25973.1 hypothetical protein N3C_2611 [Clostridium sp. N3C]